MPRQALDKHKITLKKRRSPQGATVTVGAAAPTKAPPCAFYHVKAAAGDTVHVAFENKIRIYTWVANQTDGSYSIPGERAVYPLMGCCNVVLLLPVMRHLIDAALQHPPCLLHAASRNADWLAG